MFYDVSSTIKLNFHINAENEDAAKKLAEKLEVELALAEAEEVSFVETNIEPEPADFDSWIEEICIYDETSYEELKKVFQSIVYKLWDIQHDSRRRAFPELYPDAE